MTEYKDDIELVRRANEFLQDDRVSRVLTLKSPLGYAQLIAQSILKRYEGAPNLAEGDRKLLEKQVSTYDRVLQLNSTYAPSVQVETSDILNETADFSMPYSFGRGAQSQQVTACRNSVIPNFQQVKAGEYFWNYHLVAALHLLTVLNQIGVKNTDLEQRANNMFERLDLKQNGR